MQAHMRRLATGPILLLLVTLLGCTAVPVSADSQVLTKAESHWVQVDTTKLTLHLMQGDVPLLTFENIAIGSNGATWNKLARDEKTPMGDFKIIEIRRSQRFHRFLSFDYPTLDHAERALRNGRIGAREYSRIQEAWDKGEPPPQNTRLGGQLGIHGIGAGSLEIHNMINWTNGCIALTNEQLDELASRISPGTRIRIR